MSESFLFLESNDHLTTVPGLKEAIITGDLSDLKGFKLDTGDNFNAFSYPIIALTDAFDQNRVISLSASNGVFQCMYLLMI